MQSLHPNVSVVNPQLVNWNSVPTLRQAQGPAAFVSVDRDPDGTYLWRIERTDGRMSTRSREAFADFDAAADAAASIAEAKGLPLAADVSLFVEMASPFYSGREHEMAAPEYTCQICGQAWSKCRCAAQKTAVL